MEGYGSRERARPRRSTGKPPQVSAGIFPGISRNRLRQGFGRKRSLRIGSPYPARAGLISPRNAENYMKIDAIILRELHMQLVRPFETRSEEHTSELQSLRHL